VTFSKRRSGLFKKASELCTLCGVEIAIVVFSPAGKVFSFGHPKVESVTDRFLARKTNPKSASLHLFESHGSASIPELNKQLMYMVNEFESEKKRSEALDQMRKDSQSQFWWEAPIEDLSLHELQQLKDAMEELKKSVAIHANNIIGGVDRAPIMLSYSGDSHVNNYGYVHDLL